MDGAIRNITRSIGDEWKKIGNNRKEIHFPNIIGTCS